MNDELQKEFITIINSTIDTVGQTKNFLLEQLPDVIQQTLQWYLISNMLTIFISILALVGCIFLFKLVKNAKKSSWAFDSNGDIEFLGVASYSVSILGSFFSILFILNSLYSALQILIAPKLWLIQFAATLTSSN